MEMIHRLNSGTATLAHTTQREKKRDGRTSSSMHPGLKCIHRSGRHGDDELSLSYFHPCAFDLSSMDGKKEIFIENRYSIQIRAGCNILPGAAAPETPPLSG
jgi:hypothetical protein